MKKAILGACVSMLAVVSAPAYAQSASKVQVQACSINDKTCGADATVFRGDYDRIIAEVLGESGLEVPPLQRPILGGRPGHHSEHLGHLLAGMQFLPRTYPDAPW